MRATPRIDGSSRAPDPSDVADPDSSVTEVAVHADVVEVLHAVGERRRSCIGAAAGRGMDARRSLCRRITR
jgi:hypothetical protein